MRARFRHEDRASQMRSEGGRREGYLDHLSRPVHGAVIDTYEDHRIAMCFSVLGTVVPGIIIRHPGCVKKLFQTSIRS